MARSVERLFHGPCEDREAHGEASGQGMGALLGGSRGRRSLIWQPSQCIQMPTCQGSPATDHGPPWVLLSLVGPGGAAPQSGSGLWPSGRPLAPHSWQPSPAEGGSGPSPPPGPHRAAHSPGLPARSGPGPALEATAQEGCGPGGRGHPQAPAVCGADTWEVGPLGQHLHQRPHGSRPRPCLLLARWPGTSPQAGPRAWGSEPLQMPTEACGTPLPLAAAMIWCLVTTALLAKRVWCGRGVPPSGHTQNRPSSGNEGLRPLPCPALPLRCQPAQGTERAWLGQLCVLGQVVQPLCACVLHSKDLC